MKAGFIGLGQMGHHMASNILRKGNCHLVVHDIRKEAASSLIKEGAEWADTPAQVASLCDIVITCLPTPKIVEEVVYGSNGLKEGWKKGDIYIDMSTNSPSLIRKIAQDAHLQGVTVLDAPVSGGTAGAQAGTLTIMVGGDTSALNKVKGILEAMGKKIVHVGDVGCGNIAKLINNMISLVCNSVSAEAFLLGKKAGINPKVLWEIVAASTGDNGCVRRYPNTTFKGNFEPGFKISLAYKDIGLAIDLGNESGISLPLAVEVKKELQKSMEEGFSDKDVDAVILPMEKAAGVKVRVNGD
jgi:3-hydroxyisobutyrate dehydrogenase